MTGIPRAEIRTNDLRRVVYHRLVGSHRIFFELLTGLARLDDVIHLLEREILAVHIVDTDYRRRAARAQTLDEFEAEESVLGRLARANAMLVGQPSQFDSGDDLGRVQPR